MAKKRKGLGNTRSLSKHIRRSRSYDKQLAAEENRLLAILYSDPGEQSITSLQKPGAKKGERKDLEMAINSLFHAGLIVKTKRNRYLLAAKAPLYEGLLHLHPDGFGFVKVLQIRDKAPKLERDLFISAGKIGAAFHDDRVLVRMIHRKRDGRGEGVIIKILMPRDNKLFGVVQKRGKKTFVIPDDFRLPFQVSLPAEEMAEIPDGEMVQISFKRNSMARKMIPGRLEKRLGSSKKVDAQLAVVSATHLLPGAFSKEVTDELAELPKSMVDLANRKDLRATPHLTIDGADAKDFDDAICVTKTSAGYRLYVSIADVSHYVREGTALDKEAYERGTSIYFPQRVIPMLPEKLSNDLCSLRPGEDKLTLTAELSFDREGRLADSRFYRSIIRSKKRCIYEEVEELFKNSAANGEPTQKDAITTQLFYAKELAKLLRKKRLKAGALDFNLREPKIALDKTGAVSALGIVDRLFAHQLIEEFMLAANKAVAVFLQGAKTTPLLRVHELPDQKKLTIFARVAKRLGLEIPPPEPVPQWFAASLATAAGTRYEYLVNNMLLRAMNQARYSLKPLGHFGLAESSYCHFTSPIRRYPDLIVHRQLMQALREAEAPSRLCPDSSLNDAASLLSLRERRAVDAERDINLRLQTIHMADHLGEVFSAIISGVHEDKLYLELSNGVSGLIPVEMLSDDYYIFDERQMSLLGEMSMKRYQMGDQLRVELLDVDLYKRRLIFRPYR